MSRISGALVSCPSHRKLATETSTQTLQCQKVSGGQPRSEQALLLMTSRDESQEKVSVPTVSEQRVTIGQLENSSGRRNEADWEDLK